MTSGSIASASLIFSRRNSVVSGGDEPYDRSVPACSIQPNRCVGPCPQTSPRRCQSAIPTGELEGVRDTSGMQTDPTPSPRIQRTLNPPPSCPYRHGSIGWPAVRWLAGYRPAWLPADTIAGGDDGGLCDPGFAGLCWTGRPAAPQVARRLEDLLGGLGYALLALAPAGDRSDIGHFLLMIAATVGGMADGDAHRQVLRSPAHGLYGGPCRRGLGPAAQHTRAADQEGQRPGGIKIGQHDDRDDADPEPA